MHTYKYIVAIGLSCAECGTMSREVLRNILEESFDGCPAEIVVEDYGEEKGCEVTLADLQKRG